MIWEQLDASIIFTGMDAADRDEVLTRLGGAMVRAGYGKENYVEALLAREAEYPTGLPCEGLGVAIPHTAKDYVLKPGIAVAVLDKPVPFIGMGSDEAVAVRLVLVLAVTDANGHVDGLQKLMELIQDKEMLQKVAHALTADEIIGIFKDREEQS